MAVIADLASYPDWVNGIQEVEVLTEYEDGRPAEARFVLDSGAIKDRYTLEYTWDGDDSVSWRLVAGDLLTAMDGEYRLSGSGATTEVAYLLAVDLKIPMIGLIKRKAEKVIVDTALKGLKARVEG
jgi:ribosome-associated toxin RatA of RatAB toxin-antitoxin module